jgi:hypothetical protein
MRLLSSGFRAFDTTPRDKSTDARVHGVEQAAPSGQYIAYTFYKVDPAWRRLPDE